MAWQLLQIDNGLINLPIVGLQPVLNNLPFSFANQSSQENPIEGHRDRNFLDDNLSNQASEKLIELPIGNFAVVNIGRSALLTLLIHKVAAVFIVVLVLVFVLPFLFVLYVVEVELFVELELLLHLRMPFGCLGKGFCRLLGLFKLFLRLFLGDFTVELLKTW